LYKNLDTSDKCEIEKQLFKGIWYLFYLLIPFSHPLGD
jgi:hypothetical protein